MLVDSHTHVATGDTDRYPLRPTGVGSDWWREGADVGALLASMDSAGVDAAVIVQAVGAYGYDCSYAVDAAATSPHRLALVGAVDMDAADPAGHLVGAAVRVFGVGDADPPPWLTDGRAAAVWAAAAAAGTGIVATLWARDLPALRPLVESHPTVPVAVDHCGFVDFGGDPAGAAPLLDLADLPAVHLKVSTHVLHSLEDPAGLVSRLADRFGADRLCWGSDFPQTQGTTYGGMVELGRRAASGLDAHGRDRFLGGTARSLWFR